MKGLGRRTHAGFRVQDAAFDKDAPPLAVDMASFVGCFVSRDVIAACGTPDPRLFIYGDDLLYTLHLTQVGCQLVFDPTLRFEHDCGTFQEGLKIYAPTWKAYYNYRNGILLYRAVAGRLSWLLLALRLPKWIWAATRYGTKRRLYLRLLLAAVKDGVTERLDRPPPESPASRTTD